MHGIRQQELPNGAMRHTGSRFRVRTEQIAGIEIWQRNGLLGHDRATRSEEHAQ
jgi:hypothetical protein